jgi:hypothetical protein
MIKTWSGGSLFNYQKQATTAHIPQMAEAVHRELPDEVKELLRGNNYNTIFLAPRGTTVNLPWELVRVPGRKRDGGEKEGIDVGLRGLLHRTHGVGELMEVPR